MLDESRGGPTRVGGSESGLLVEEIGLARLPVHKQEEGPQSEKHTTNLNNK